MQLLNNKTIQNNNKNNNNKEKNNKKQRKIMQNYFDNEATSSTLHATMKPARGGKSLVTFSTYEVCMHATCTHTYPHT